MHHFLCAFPRLSCPSYSTVHSTVTIGILYLYGTVVCFTGQTTVVLKGVDLPTPVTTSILADYYLISIFAGPFDRKGEEVQSQL